MSESNESQHSTSRRRWWLYALSLVVIAIVGGGVYSCPNLARARGDCGAVGT